MSLRGVESVVRPIPQRKRAWERLAQDLPEGALNDIVHIVRDASLEEVLRYAQQMVEGRGRGRIVVDPNA